MPWYSVGKASWYGRLQTLQFLTLPESDIFIMLPPPCFMRGIWFWPYATRGCFSKTIHTAPFFLVLFMRTELAAPFHIHELAVNCDWPVSQRLAEENTNLWREAGYCVLFFFAPGSLGYSQFSSHPSSRLVQLWKVLSLSVIWSYLKDSCSSLVILSSKILYSPFEVSNAR